MIKDKAQLQMNIENIVMNKKPFTNLLLKITEMSPYFFLGQIPWSFG